MYVSKGTWSELNDSHWKTNRCVPYHIPTSPPSPSRSLLCLFHHHIIIIISSPYCCHFITLLLLFHHIIVVITSPYRCYYITLLLLLHHLIIVIPEKTCCRNRGFEGHDGRVERNIQTTGGTIETGSVYYHHYNVYKWCI